jgi:hypothetical protein
MPLPNGVQPTISQIYTAFSSASHRVFQAAMANSTGGVVRVQDLLAALLDLECELGRRILPAGSTALCPRPTRDNQHLVPMANEPALRATLRIAYVIAADQPNQQPPVITPATLWAAVFVERHMTCRLSVEDAFRRLRLYCPADLQPTPAIRPRASPVRMPPLAPDVEKACDDRNLVDVILERWLAAQVLPAGEQRDQEMARILQLTKRLESQPVSRWNGS